MSPIPLPIVGDGQYRHNEMADHDICQDGAHAERITIAEALDF